MCGSLRRRPTSRGASHSLTLAEPLRMRELGKRRYAVKGTPTDCVIMGVRFLLRDKPPDLVLSGVNRGQNLADDVTYSGTVAGAIEGTLLGVPSIALSLALGPAGSPELGTPKWQTPMRHGADFLRKLLDAGWPEGVVLNVNFPDCEPDEVKGMAVTHAGPAQSRPAPHRGPARYARQTLLLGRLRAPQSQAAEGHRPLGGALGPHLGHAAQLDFTDEARAESLPRRSANRPFALRQRRTVSPDNLKPHFRGDRSPWRVSRTRSA